MCCLTSLYLRLFCVWALFLAIDIPLWAQLDSLAEETHINHGFIDLNAYRDTRSFSELTINLLSNVHPRVQYFSFTNNTGASNTTDTQTFYSEQNVRWMLSKTGPLDLTGQLTLRTGDDNDNFKIGLRVRFNNLNPVKTFFRKINMIYSLNIHLAEFGSGQPARTFVQFEHAYRINLFPNKIDNRVYIGGFADQNFRAGSEEDEIMWVSEHQLGIRVIDQFYLVAELRVNDFLSKDNYGLGYGLEYNILF